MDTGLPMEFAQKGIGDACAASSHDMANAMRVLAWDAAAAMASDRPNDGLAMADVATVLWTRFLKFDPSKPNWPDRDRIVLAAGGTPMLLDAFLYLTGYENTTIDALKCSHQRGPISKERPAFGRTSGMARIKPCFGQGLANAVGMALAERIMSEQHGTDLVDHHTFMFADHACLTGGLSREAASLAGQLKLGRLIVFFDDHRTSIGDDSCSDDILNSFEVWGWDVFRIDGHDHEAIRRAIEGAKPAQRPSLIVCRTATGRRGSGKPSTLAPASPRSPFFVPEDVKRAWRLVGEHGKSAQESWEIRFMGKDDLSTRAKFGRAQAGGLFDGWRAALVDHCRELIEEQSAISGNEAARAALDRLTQSAPNIIDVIGGAPGSNTMTSGSHWSDAVSDVLGRDLRLEGSQSVMAAIMNGIAQHGGLLPLGEIVQGFSGKAKRAIRQAALMGLRTVYVLPPANGFGEDQPTGCSDDHWASLQAIPNLDVMRPADAVEMAECWALALRRREGPSVMALSHQTMTALRKTHSDDNRSERGAYVLADASSGLRAMTILAMGAEVQIALQARERLEAMGMPTAVVSMPCFERFDHQPYDYRTSVLGAAPRLAIDAKDSFGWTRYVDSKDDVIGVTTASAVVTRVLDRSGQKLGA